MEGGGVTLSIRVWESSTFSWRSLAVEEPFAAL